MRILSQTDCINGYHGTVGALTNMYDYNGNKLYVGDVVCLATFNSNEKTYDCGIEFVCEENISIVSWTGENLQYVMGIASIYNNNTFKVLQHIPIGTEEWREKFETIDSEFRIYKAKDHSFLALGEQIGFLKVVDVDDEEYKAICEK